MTLFDRFGGDDGNDGDATEGANDAEVTTDGGSATVEDHVTELPEDDTDSSAFDGSSATDGAVVEELEHRIDGIESELSGLSSTVETVRGENEAIETTVEDVEADVRKLLDIYEIVTRDVNPFTDGEPEAGSFGLFGADGSSPPTSSDGGTSFEELKAEYEDLPSSEPISEPEPEPTTAAPAGTLDEPTGGSTRAERPYLRSIPDGYVTDLLVLDWLEYLVAAAGPAEAEAAIEYYASIEWIGEDAADRLRSVLWGLEAGEGTGSLTVDHHTRSLQYIARLANSTAPPVVLEGWQNGGRGSGR